MKIITWNINGIRAVLHKGFHDFWQRENPDILCLQETKAHPDQLLGVEVQPLGWSGDWFSAQRPGYSGVATFCREAPLEVTRGIHIPKFDAEGRVLITKFAAFTLFNIYFPNGGSGEERHKYKQEFLRRLHQHLDKRLHSGEKLIVVGDYNIAYLDIDVYNPTALANESGFLGEEREWMKSFLGRGFVDCFRHFHPTDAQRFSWWSYQQNGRAGNRGWRIDHICVSDNLAPQLLGCEILDQQQGSDHCPVVLELRT